MTHQIGRTRNITCHYIETSDGQTLTDHHSRDGELLLYATVSGDMEMVKTDLWGSLQASARNLPPSIIGDDAIQKAISDCVEGMTADELLPSYIEDDDTDLDGELPFIYCYLSWELLEPIVATGIATANQTPSAKRTYVIFKLAPKDGADEATQIRDMAFCTTQDWASYRLEDLHQIIQSKGNTEDGIKAHFEFNNYRISELTIDE